ncbi:unnamed protein product [Schistocephalus solidus]|uniref:Uncharacterized protein n=1 Tax=Schistocephalus solidus TaxID=70667 RepID=A0A3P7F484_SCHSO|nr:unnamed protein product [Schistocephalus solidus]
MPPSEKTSELKEIPLDDVLTEAGEKEDRDRMAPDPPFSTSPVSDPPSHSAVHSSASPIPKWTVLPAHCQGTSPLPSSRFTETTVVSSAGVSEFCPHHPQLLQPSEHVPLRFLRRSLGELPWPRNLHSDFADIIAENRYLTPPSYLWPRQYVCSPDSDFTSSPAAGRPVPADRKTTNSRPRYSDISAAMSLRNSGMRSLSTTAAVHKTELLLPPRQPPPSQQHASPTTSTDPTASEVRTPPPVHSLASPTNQDAAAAFSKRKRSASTALKAHL